MKKIIVEELRQTPIEEQRIEIVERKGLGHPDTICDSIVNEISVNLSKEYLKEVGHVLHHNIDKALLAAGRTENRYGGGIVKKPMKLVLGDRAISYVGDTYIPVHVIAVSTAKDWLKKNINYLDPLEHVEYQCEIERGSAALTDIFEREGGVLGANDTSAAVGYAPLSETEKIVLETEKFLNTKDFKKEFPETGQDVKVMGSRVNENLNLIVAINFVDKFIKSEKDYFRKKEEALEELKDHLDGLFDFNNITYKLNNLDRRGRGISGIYVTVTGTCADGSDCGQVGRGNTVKGVIPLNRPTSSEAAAGKNPVSHVGKIYNVLSYMVAEEVYKRVPGLKEVYVWMLSEIGRPIDDPAVAAAQVIPEKGNSLKNVKKEVQEVVDSELENINDFCMDLALGKIEVC